MKRLNKHKLDFSFAWKYVQDDLDKTNALSSELLNLLNFKNGYFFTLLPDDANTQAIHNFKVGGILPQNPIEEYFLNGHKATYSIKTSIRDELSQLILKEMASHKRLSCIFDDVGCSPTKSKGYPLFDSHGLFYENESYYLLQKSKISIELIEECLKVSNAFWHSLCLFTTADFSGVTKILNLEKIKEICLTTEMVMIGAYDAEGYVFWEKKLTNVSKNFFAK
jgi:hypothetical protein